MPIDFAAIAAELRDPLTRQVVQVNLLFVRIGLVVDRLAKRATELERATSHLPVFDFPEGALAVWVRVAPEERLVMGPDGLVAGLKAGGLDAVAGLMYVPTAIRQELAFADLARTMADPLAAFAADPAGLHKLLTTTKQRVMDNKERLTAMFGSAAAGAPASAAPDIDAVLGVGARLEELALLLPALPEIMMVILRDGALIAERELLAPLMALEDTVYDVRKQVLEGVLLAVEGLGRAAMFLHAVEYYVKGTLAPFVTLPGVFSAFAESLAAVWHGIKLWVDWVVKMVSVYADVFGGLAGVDLAPILFGPLISLIPSRLRPKITLGDLVEGGIQGTLLALRTTLHAAWALVQPFPLTKEVAEANAGVDDLIDALVAFRYPDLGHASPYAGPRTGFVDVYGEMFGGGADAQLLKTVDQLGLDLRKGASGLLDAGANTATSLGTTFAGQARRLHLGRRFLERGVGEEPAELAHRVFGERFAPGTDPLALEWERLVADGGFTLAAASIPALVVEMRGAWRARRPPADQPISPHALLRQARSAGMHLSEVTVVADGSTLDGGGAEAIAAAVAARLGDAATASIHRAELTTGVGGG